MGIILADDAHGAALNADHALGTGIRGFGSDIRCRTALLVRPVALDGHGRGIASRDFGGGAPGEIRQHALVFGVGTTRAHAGGQGMLGDKGSGRRHHTAPPREQIHGFQQGIVIIPVAVHGRHDRRRTVTAHTGQGRFQKLRHAPRIDRKSEDQHIAGRAAQAFFPLGREGQVPDFLLPSQ